MSLEGQREALCTLGNGYFATRGAAPEGTADGVHYPGTYVAGVYNRLRAEVSGRVVENESLVNAPNWLPISFRAEGGRWFGGEGSDILSHYQELDMYRGVLVRRTRWRDADGRVVQVAQRRFVSMRDPHLAGLETTVVPENWEGRLEVRSALDGRVANSGVARYRALGTVHLDPRERRRRWRGHLARGGDQPVAHPHRHRSPDQTVPPWSATRAGGRPQPERRLHRAALPGRCGPRRRGHRGEDRGVVHLQGHGHQRTPSAGPGVGWQRGRFVRGAPGPPRPGLEPPVAPERGSRLPPTTIWPRSSTCTPSTSSRPSRRTRSAWMWVSRPGACTARPTGGMCSGTSCSCSPSSTLRFPELTRSLLRYRYRRLDQARRAATAAGYRGPCSLGRAAVTGGRRPRPCISTPCRAGGGPTRPGCNITPTRRW